MAPTVAVACQPRLRWDRVHTLADAAQYLEAGDIGVEAGAARGPFLLRQREDCGGEDGGGVGLGRIKIVVEVERVRCGAVHQRRPWRRQPRALADRGGRARAPVTPPLRTRAA